MPVIEVDHLQKRYGEKVAVDDVSFTVEQGEIFGVLGPNGAGKTTTVECVQGCAVPTAGPSGCSGWTRCATAPRCASASAPSSRRASCRTRCGCGGAGPARSFYRNRADIDELLTDLGLAEQRNTYFQKLSGGQKQRLSVALALVGGPEIAILDGLTTGLDPQGRRDTWDLVGRIRDRGVTVVLVTHFMEEAQRLCDRIAIIDKGRMVAVEQLWTARPGRQRAPGALPPGGAGRGRPAARRARRDRVSRYGAEVTVTGTKDVQSVLAVLSGRGTTYTDLRVEQPTLDDAFVALTGRGGRAAAQSPTDGRSS
ncbi:ABC transporter ATP-binding protein [Micromonospora sp. BRA006-A]|nr:ABC transporter ATP-binding protein [Micromonospora sp. BRA006-A]